MSVQTKTKKKYERTLIYEGHDEFGPVEVVENDKMRTLHLGTSVPQSEMFLKEPYKIPSEYILLMTMALLFHPHPKNVLVLGLGGGTLPKFLWKYFPTCRIDIVERSTLVIDLAYRFFKFPKSPRINIHNTGALEFIKDTENQYDLIFIDLFEGDKLASAMNEKNFFNICQKRLTKKGILVWNTWKLNPQDLIDNFQKLCEIFGKDLLILPTKGWNNIFLAFPTTMEKFPLYRVVQNARKLTEKTHVDYLEILANLNFLKDFGWIAQS